MTVILITLGVVGVAFVVMVGIPFLIYRSFFATPVDEHPRKGP